MNLNKLAVRCSELKLDLDAFGLELEAYGIALDTLTELVPLLTGIDELNNSVRKAILKRKSVTQTINELERAIDEVIRFELEGLLLVFKANYPDFNKAFRNARMIIDYGHRPGERDDGAAA